MARMMTVKIPAGKTACINPEHVMALLAQPVQDSTWTFIQLTHGVIVESVEEPHVIKQKWEAASD